MIHIGHDKGDNYITTSAAIIKKCFSTIGNCYRMGGDEFCVLIKGASMSACETYAKKLEKEAIDYTKNHPEEFPIKIACGYTSYDASIDYDISDTLRRADKKMYQDKINKKTYNLSINYCELPRYLFNIIINILKSKGFAICSSIPAFFAVLISSANA